MSISSPYFSSSIRQASSNTFSARSLPAKDGGVQRPMSSSRTNRRLSWEMAVPARCRTNSWVNTRLTSQNMKFTKLCSSVEPCPTLTRFPKCDLLSGRTRVTLGLSPGPKDL